MTGFMASQRTWGMLTRLRKPKEAGGLDLHLVTLFPTQSWTWSWIVRQRERSRLKGLPPWQTTSCSIAKSLTVTPDTVGLGSCYSIWEPKRSPGAIWKDFRVHLIQGQLRKPNLTLSLNEHWQCVTKLSHYQIECIKRLINQALCWWVQMMTGPASDERVPNLALPRP